MSSLSDIKNFISVSETLNITRSSEVMGVTQPTMSYSIKRLEKELGGELIIRLKNGVQLTKLGESFLAKARKLEFDWSNLVNTSKMENADFRGKYIFAIHPSVALSNMSLFLPKITEFIPGLSIEFIHGLSREMTEKVINWQADFGIVINPIKHPDLVIKHLSKDVVTLFKTKNAKNKIIYDPSLNQSQQILKKVNESNYNGKIHSNNLEVIAKLAGMGEGVALLPETVAKKYKDLVKVVKAPFYNDTLCLIYRPEKHKNSVSRKIIKLINESF